MGAPTYPFPQSYRPGIDRSAGPPVIRGGKVRAGSDFLVLGIGAPSVTLFYYYG